MKLLLTIGFIISINIPLQAADLMPQCSNYEYQNEAEEYLSKIKKGDKKANFAMAELCEQISRYESNKNYHLARHYYLNAIKDGDERAYFPLGQLYEHGLGGEKDLAQAFKYYESDTSGKSLYDLGRFYEHGLGTEKNPQKALESYLKGQNQDSHCKLAYAIILEEGLLGQKVNIAEALKLYGSIKGICHHHDPKHQLKNEAMFRQARLLEKDKGDNAEWYIVHLYKECHNYLPACLRLGEIYEKGLHSERPSTDDALKYYKAAHLRSPEAAMHVVRLLQQTTNFLGRDTEPAFPYALSAWNQGSSLPNDIIVPLAHKALRYRTDFFSRDIAGPCLFLSDCHQKGHHVPKNPELASSWMQIAANTGSIQAIKKFADLLWVGKDLPKDLLKAADYYERYANIEDERIKDYGDLPFKKTDRQAEVMTLLKEKALELHAKKNKSEVEQKCHLELHYRVGSFHQSGFGIKATNSEAQAYYQIAAEGFKHQDAVFKYAQLCDQGVECKKDEAAAFTHYQWLGQQNFTAAFYPLGLCYLYGKGVEKNPSQAITFLEKAYNAGQKDGFKILKNFYLDNNNEPALLRIEKERKATKEAKSMRQPGQAEYEAAEAGLKDYFSHRSHIGHGDTWPQDYYQKKITPYEEALRQGFSSVDAKFKIAFCSYRLSDKWHHKKNPLCEKYYRESAQAGHAEAQYEYVHYLEHAYDDDNSDDSDTENSPPLVVKQTELVNTEQWLKKSADQGFRLAQLKLAKFYKKHNPAQAVEYYIKTIMNQSNGKSYLNLAEIKYDDHPIGTTAIFEFEDMFVADLNKCATSLTWDENLATIEAMMKYFGQEIPDFIKHHEHNYEHKKSLIYLDRLARSALFLVQHHQHPNLFLTAYETQPQYKEALASLYINRPDGTRLLSLLPLPQDFMAEVFDDPSHFFQNSSINLSTIADKQHLFKQVASLIKNTTPLRNLLMAKILIDNQETTW